MMTTALEGAFKKHDAMFAKHRAGKHKRDESDDEEDTDHSLNEMFRTSNLGSDDEDKNLS